MNDLAFDVPACGCGPAAACRGPATARAGGREFDALLEASLDGVLWLGPCRTILRANAAACELLALPASRIVGMHARELVAPRDLRAASLIEQCRLEGHSSGTLTGLQADGTPVEVRVRLARYTGADDEPHAMVVFRPAGGAEAGAVHACGRELPHFAPSLARDLRAPLGTLAGFAKALQRELGDEAPQRSGHYLQRIMAAAAQLDSHLEALLSCASLARAPIAARPVDLSAAARRILRGLQLRDLDRIAAVEVQDGLWADGDPGLLQIALENLLDNAWKFTRHRAEATISFTAQAAPDGSTVYRVRDDGAGFDMSYAGKLFRDFQRLHSQAEFPGTGIGLANVQRIVERHGGRVWAESAPGQGATFSFTLGNCAAPSPCDRDPGCQGLSPRRI